MTIIKIDDEIGYWGITASEVSRQLDEASGDITVEINSPGGSIFEGISIFNAIKAYSKGHVTTIVTSLAASMGSIIALAGDTIKAYDNSVYMIHNGSTSAWGDATELRKQANHIESLTKLMSNIYIAKTGNSESEMSKLLDDETFFYGSEILDAGFVDEMIATNSQSDQSSLMALASESFKSCMFNSKEKTKDEDDTLIAAAIKSCKTNGVNRSQEALAENQNSNQGNSMNYTKETFEALSATHAKALKDENATALSSERERVSGIMALNGNAEFTAKAIKDGSSIGDSAIALLKIQGEAHAKHKVDFENAAADVEKLGQSSEEEEDLSVEQKACKEADDALAKF